MRPDDNETRFELAPYFHGKILDVSEGTSRAFPHFISHIELGIDDPANLAVLANNSMDGIFSSYLLHLLSPDSCREVLAAWQRVLKPEAHLMLHLPTNHPKALWEVSYGSVRQLVGAELVHFWQKDDDLLFVFGPGGKKKRGKTCGLVRLGAFGDCIQASSILPWLKEQGYDITWYISDHGYPVVKHDPHVDRFVIQGRDEIPPQVLGDFWEYESKKYDKWVNLSESVEGTLLAAPGSTRCNWPDSVKAKYMDVNYLEFTHEIAEVPPPYRPKFYATEAEKAWAREKARSYGRNILWSLSGSSVHKTWPHLDAIVARVMLAYPDVHIVMVGDEASQILEAGWQKEKRVHRFSGVWSIRESMAFAEVADLIIGTETGLLNAAGSMDTPKIVTLSHSSEEMLTKYWKNVIALQQPKGIGCPKSPCRILHQDWSLCMKYQTEDTASAMCQWSVDTEMMWGAIVKVLGIPQRKVA